MDAEALAEGGIAEAYERLLLRLRDFVANPVEIIEERDDDSPSYLVRFGDKSFPIYGFDTDDMSESWENATVALFTIVNDQLANSTHRFYAINGGNDLFGMFLTPAQAEEVRANESDWPYLPNEPEWSGGSQ